MEKLLKRFEHYLVIGLLAMMALVVLLATIELAAIIGDGGRGPLAHFLVEAFDLAVGHQ